MIEHPEDDYGLRAETKRLADELDAAYADRDRNYYALQVERDKRRQLTRRLADLMKELGLW